MKAYWFSNKGLAQHGTIIYEVRPEPYIQEGEITACHNGLHASVDPYDALHYAAAGSPTLDLVELGGTIVEHHGDKVAASKRTHLKRIDATSTLREYARWCVLQVVSDWDCPELVKRYLETGDETIRAESREIAYEAMLNTRTESGYQASLAAVHASTGYTPSSVVRECRSAARAAREAFAERGFRTNTGIEARYDEAKSIQRAKFNEMIEAAFNQVDLIAPPIA